MKRPRTQKVQRQNHCVLGEDGVGSSPPANNFPGILVDSDRFDCLVENSGLDVAPRRVENPIRQGQFQYVRRGIGQSARVPWPQKQKVGGYLLDTTKAVATRRGTRLVVPTLRAPGDQDTEKDPSLAQSRTILSIGNARLPAQITASRLGDR